MPDSSIYSRLDGLPCELRGQILSMVLEQTALWSGRHEVILVIWQGKMHWSTSDPSFTSICLYRHLVCNLSSKTYEQFIEMICPRTTFHFQDSESFDAIMRGPLESDVEKAGDNMRLHQKIQILHQNMKMISYCFPGAKGVDTHLQRPPSLKDLCLCPWYRSYRSHEISGHRSCRNEVSCFEIQYGPVDARNTAQGPNLRLVYLEGSREVGTRTATREKKRVPRSKVRKDDNRLKAKKLKAGEGNRDNLFQNLCSLHSQPVRTFLNIFQEASKKARKEAQGGTLACGLIFSSIWYLGALQFYGPVPAKLLIEYGYDG